MVVLVALVGLAALAALVALVARIGAEVGVGNCEADWQAARLRTRANKNVADRFTSLDMCLLSMSLGAKWAIRAQPYSDWAKRRLYPSNIGGWRLNSVTR
jgi:hypothetical protein